jgi:hypothetical protein
MVRNALEYVRQNNWMSHKKEYLTLVDSLCEADGHRNG